MADARFVLDDYVVEVLYKSLESQEWSVGSGLVVCGRRVLTAAHNVDVSGELIVRLRGVEEHKATLATLRNGKCAVDADCDIAILEIAEPFQDRPSVDFARINRRPELTTNNIGECWSVGFPRFQEKTRDAVGRPLRESIRVDGYIPIGEGLVEGRPTLAAIRGPRPEIPAVDMQRSEWEGMSGAVVFAGRLAVGVITEHHVPAGSQALTIAPISLLDEGPDAPDWWALLGVDDPKTVVVAGRRSPRPHQRRLFDDYRIVAGRDRELQQLTDFISAYSSGYYLVTANAGIGKTALLVEFVRRLLLSQQGYPIYYFINRQYDTADNRMDMGRSLLRQLSEALGKSSRSTDSWMDIEDAWSELLDVEHVQRPVVIVIDAIDEADGWALPRTLFPERLPDGVHVILSMRVSVERDWATMFGQRDVNMMQLTPLDDASTEAVLRRVGTPKWLFEPGAFETLTSRAQGDPFYLRLLADLALSGAITNAQELSRVDPGLDRYISTWWRELNQSATPTPATQCLITYLTVAIAPITKAELVCIDDSDALNGITFDFALESVERFVVGDSANGGISFGHWRLQEYMSRVVLTHRERATVNDKFVAWCDRWPTHSEQYVLTRGVKHRLIQVESSLETNRPAHLREVVEILTHADYQRARIHSFGDASGFARDSHEVLRHLCCEPDPDIGALALIAAGLVDATYRWLVPQTAFDLADRGAWTNALELLEELPGDDVWLAAARLVLLWQMSDQSPMEALRLLNDKPTEQPVLSNLSRYVHAAAQRASKTVLRRAKINGSLWNDAQSILSRYAAPPTEDDALHDIRPLSQHPEQLEAEVENETATLVQVALSYPGYGTDCLEKYIRLRAANPYSDYRNRSLLLLLASVTEVEDWEPVRHLARIIIQGALNPSPVRFGDCLTSSVRGREVRSGLRGVDYVMAGAGVLKQDAESLSAGIFPYVIEGYSYTHGYQAPRADLWSFLRRRMAGMAEVLNRLDEHDAAVDLLDCAVLLPSGFAGFLAPAMLTLAESNHVIRPLAELAFQECLTRARVASHNIQDPVLCARTVARVRAITECDLGHDSDLPGIVDRFVASNGILAQFQSVHRIGEPLEARDTRYLAPLADLASAVTLKQLSLIYDSPLMALAEANPGVERDAVLGLHTAVVVPDRGFAPLVATWLSSKLVAAGTLALEERIRLLARLVPVAVSNSTAVDTLLARLVTLTSGSDLDALRRGAGHLKTHEPLSGMDFGYEGQVNDYFALKWPSRLA